MMEKMNNCPVVLYTAPDGKTKLDVKLENETVWLTQAQMSLLFDTTPQNITMHIRRIYKEEELMEEPTCKESLHVRIEGNRTVTRNTKFYNLGKLSVFAPTLWQIYRQRCQ